MLSTYLRLKRLSHREFPLHGEIQSLPAWAVDGVAAHVATGECRRRSKSSGIEPPIGCPGVRVKNRCSGVVCTNRILTQQRARVRSITKDRDRKRKP